MKQGGSSSSCSEYLVVPSNTGPEVQDSGRGSNTGGLDASSTQRPEVGMSGAVLENENGDSNDDEGSREN
jgi:hypothetical protein